MLCTFYTWHNWLLYKTHSNVIFVFQNTLAEFFKTVNYSYDGFQISFLNNQLYWYFYIVLILIKMKNHVEKIKLNNNWNRQKHNWQTKKTRLLRLYMRKMNPLNVICAIKVFTYRKPRRFTLHPFMKERNHSNVSFSL